MSYKPKDFTVEAGGYYDALYGRERDAHKYLEKNRELYYWAYNMGDRQRQQDYIEKGRLNK